MEKTVPTSRNCGQNGEITTLKYQYNLQVEYEDL